MEFVIFDTGSDLLGMKTYLKFTSSEHNVVYISNKFSEPKYSNFQFKNVFLCQKYLTLSTVWTPHCDITFKCKYMCFFIREKFLTKNIVSTECNNFKTQNGVNVNLVL